MSNSIEQALRHARDTRDPLERIKKLSVIAQRIDTIRSTVAAERCETAVQASEHGYVQRQVADVSDVSPSMVQQWVLRGREARKAKQ